MSNLFKSPGKGKAKVIQHIRKSLVGWAGGWVGGRQNNNLVEPSYPPKANTTDRPVSETGDSEVHILADQSMSLKKEGISVSLTEERLQILKMVEEGKISAEEAAKLLSALDTGLQVEQTTSNGESLTRKARWFRVRVTDKATGKQKVSVNLPMSVVGVAMKIGDKVGPRFVPELQGVDMNELYEAVKSDTYGKIVDVDDDEGGEHVEVFIE